MLRRVFLGLVLAICAGAAVPPLRAQDNPDDPNALRPSTFKVRKAILALIDSQLKAFQAHDPAKAYSFAAPALRNQVPLQQFIAIVRTGYPEVWTNQSASYGIVRDNGGRATVAVRVKGAGGSASYDYVLLKVADGWGIGGVLRHVLQADQAL